MHCGAHKRVQGCRDGLFAPKLLTETYNGVARSSAKAPSIQDHGELQSEDAHGCVRAAALLVDRSQSERL